jgi:L-iditol 2-dehydrogenase
MRREILKYESVNQTGTLERKEAAMADMMTAAVMHQPGDIRVEEIPVPKVERGELLVHVAACGVCGSDIPRMNYSGAYRYPIVCGHEFSGWVVDAADDVRGFSEGDLVSMPPLLPCNVCASCIKGNYSLCENYDYFGSRRDGAYAEYVTVPVQNAMLMPKGIDPRAAAMMDPSAIALHALLRTKIGTGSRVAVTGAGPIGLFAVQWAKLLGAQEVLAVDLSDEKAKMAREAGATLTASSDEEALANGTGIYDVVIESAGAPATIKLAANLTAKHGDAAFIGIPHSVVEFDEATFSGFLRREISLHGSWNSFSAPFPGREWHESSVRMNNGDLKWEFMITHQLGLEALPATMKQLADRSIFSSKVLFIPGDISAW